MNYRRYAAALSLPALMGHRPSGLQCTAHNDGGDSRASWLNNHYYVHYDQLYKEYGFAAVGQPYDSATPGEPRFIEIRLSGRFA